PNSGSGRERDGSSATEESGDEESDEEDSDEEIGDLNDFKDNKDDVKLVLVVRTDLGMTKGKKCHDEIILVFSLYPDDSVGKIAAQCSHATLACYKTLAASTVQKPLLSRWEREGQPKIALQVKSEDDMFMLQAQAMSLGLCARVIQDAGRTQIASGSRTVLGILGPKSIVDSVTGHLKLL
ncbi:hypothetical protein KEM55_006448, partial [Ascosphaera atra]